MDGTERRWCFECPDCQFDHEEAGRLATDSEVYCGMCAGDCGRDVRLRRWRPDVGGANRRAGGGDRWRDIGRRVGPRYLGRDQSSVRKGEVMDGMTCRQLGGPLTWQFMMMTEPLWNPGGFVIYFVDEFPSAKASS